MLRDLDVVAEDFVVPHLERGNAGALALGALQARDVFLGLGGAVAEVVELGAEAAADDAAVGQRSGRLVGQRVVDKFDQVGHVDELAAHVRQQRRIGAGQRPPELGHERQAAPQRVDVARRRRPQRHPAGKPFHVRARPEDFADAVADLAFAEQHGHGVEPPVDGLPGEQRFGQVPPQPPRAHGGARFVH